MGVATRAAEQGPHAVGMRPASGAGRRRHGFWVLVDLTEAADMSSEPGPRVAGMRASANVAGRRRHGVLALSDLTEAAKVSRILERHCGY